MSRYRIGLTVLGILFVVIAIFSSMVGVGLFKGLLILVGLILLTIILIGGMIYLGPGPFWWNYFKPAFANPVAWGFLHIGFALLFWETSGEIWKVYWKPLLALELSVFVLCGITNKKKPFEKRLSRILLEMQFVYLFAIAGTMICLGLFWGEFAANLDRAALSRLMNSKVELAIANIERLAKDHQARPFLRELNMLAKESKKRILSKAELKRTDKLKATIQKIYAVLPEKRINWKKLWSRPEAQAKEVRPKKVRQLIGIFKLPIGEEIVGKDAKGRQLRYQKGEVIRLTQLTSPPGKYWFINKEKIPSFLIKKRVCVTGSAVGDGVIELKNDAGKELMVQVQIKTWRKRRR
ncbi:hypothetical protein GTO36_05780 [bacterium]|nr:hypothetical protein [bacterium]